MSEMSLSDVVPGLGQPRQEPPGHRRRSDRRTQEKRRKKRRRRAFVALVVALAVIGGGVFAAYAGLAPMVAKWREPDDYAGPGSGEVQIVIQPGSSGRTIAGVLADADVVKTEKAFVNLARTESDRTGTIQPGTYKVRKQMSASAALAALLSPEARLNLKATIPEGKRVSETLALLAKQLGIPRADFDAALKDPAKVGLSAASQGKPEGFLFPATYTFEPGVSAGEVLREMTKGTADALRDANVPEARWREVITKASIVQKEAGRAEDMPKVARVLENRLAKPMNLQLDSTVSYGVNKFEITTTPADRANDNPYNTYLHPGLPGGPISSPGLDAIQAVMNPAPGPWLFFVTVNPTTGETRFGTTQAEHDANVRLFQQWLRDNPEETR